jgi:hypothetical protein
LFVDNSRLEQEVPLVTQEAVGYKAKHFQDAGAISLRYPQLIVDNALRPPPHICDPKIAYLPHLGPSRSQIQHSPRFPQPYYYYYTI